MKIYFQPHMKNLMQFLMNYPFITLAVTASLSAFTTLIYQCLKEQKN